MDPSSLPDDSADGFTGWGLLLRLCVWLAVFFAPFKNAHADMLAVLIALDWVSGIWAARKQSTPERITSWRFRDTSAKVTGYLLLLIAARAAEPEAGMPLVKAAMSYFTLTEIKSLTENIERATGINLWERFRELLKGPRSQG